VTSQLVRYQLRRDSAADWTTNNPILLQGEEGYETDTGKIKVGDGTSTWSALPYFGVIDTSGFGNATFLSGEITTTTNDTQTYAALTGSDVTVEAGKTYQISWRLRTYSATTSTGLRARRVLGSSAAGTVLGMHYLLMTNGSSTQSQSSREGTNDPGLGQGNSSNTGATAGSAWIDALFACTTGGTFGLEIASEVVSSLVTVDGDGSYWTAVVRAT
jgi:hypothetical protein